MALLPVKRLILTYVLYLRHNVVLVLYSPPSELVSQQLFHSPLSVQCGCKMKDEIHMYVCTLKYSIVLIPWLVSLE